MRARRTFEGARDDGVSGVELETARNAMKKLDGRQMAFDGRRPQLLGSKRVRYVFKQMPHIGHIVNAAIKKGGNTRTYPKVYLCSKLPRSGEAATACRMSPRPTPKYTEKC